MARILWISPFSVHDLANNISRQCRNIINSLKERNVDIYGLCATIFKSDNNYCFEPSILAQLQDPAHLNERITQVMDANVPYFYVRTSNFDLNNMLCLEQRALYMELPVLLAQIKPDLILTAGSDVLSMACVNQAKQCGIPCAFVLCEPPAYGFNFRDFDLILSTSKALTETILKPQGLDATYIGPFINLNGPLYMEQCSLRLAKLTGKQGTTATATTASKKPKKDPHKAEQMALNALDAAIANLYKQADKLDKAAATKSESKKDSKGCGLKEGKQVLLYGATKEHGLGLFVKAAQRCATIPSLKHLQFTVLETETNQFSKTLSKYYERGNGQKAFTKADEKVIKVLPVGTPIAKALQDSCILMMPILSFASASFAGLEAISHGVAVLTTKQPVLEEQLGEAASFIEVEQELIDNMEMCPADSDVEQWTKALEELVTCDRDYHEICSNQMSNYNYYAGTKRLALALKPILDDCAGQNPQLLRHGYISLKCLRDEQKHKDEIAKRTADEVAKIMRARLKANSVAESEAEAEAIVYDEESAEPKKAKKGKKK